MGETHTFHVYSCVPSRNVSQISYCMWQSKHVKAPASDLIFTTSKMPLPYPAYREGNGGATCLSRLRSHGLRQVVLRQKLTVQSPPRSRHPVLRCLQRLPMALRINPQTLSHFPPMHARSLAFFHFLRQHLLFPAPGPLHVLLPLFKILPTHFFRLKPTHPLLPILRSPFHLTPD